METPPMVVDWQNQYCENDYITESNLYINAIPHNIPMTFFIGKKKSILKFIWQHR
jgi:hypothetical protein